MAIRSTDAWPGFDPAHIGYVFTLRLRPGETRALMTFVVKGLSEVYDPRGGYPIPYKDGLLTGEAVYAGADATGASGRFRDQARDRDRRRPREVARRSRPDAAAAVADRELGLPSSNDRRTDVERSAHFTVFEKSVSELQDAMTKNLVTSEDITREYLARLSLYDRNGPTFRSVLSINPRAIADARARDAERAAGKVRSPFHGVPVVFKDNIDAIELPTTGGSLALVDHRPRLDSRVAAGMKQGGAVVLGKANLDEFPFGDFGISTRRRHRRQRLRSVAEHRRDRAAAAPRRSRPAWRRSASAPTPATRCRILPRSRRWRRSGRRAA